MLLQDTPPSSESVRPQKRPRICKKGTTPLKFTNADILELCRAKPVKDSKYHVLTGAGEIPDADFESFMSYDTLPQRPAWKGIRKKDYDRVKASFEERGVPICIEMCMDDMIRFKETLIYADMDLF